MARCALCLSHPTTGRGAPSLTRIHCAFGALATINSTPLLARYRPGCDAVEDHRRPGSPASRRLRRDTERRGDSLVAVQVDVVDAHFAGFNTIYYLLEVLVFELQSVTD